MVIAYEDKKVSVALKIEQRISFGMVKILTVTLISAPSKGNFDVHIERNLRVYEKAACKLNVTCFKSSRFFSISATDLSKRFGKGAQLRVLSLPA